MQALLRFTKTQSFQKSLLDGMRNWFNWFYAVTTNPGAHHDFSISCETWCLPNCLTSKAQFKKKVHILAYICQPGTGRQGIMGKASQPGQARPGHGTGRQGRAGQGRAGHGTARHGRAGQGRARHGRAWHRMGGERESFLRHYSALLVRY